jgi:hypothetical protein
MNKILVFFLIKLMALPVLSREISNELNQMFLKPVNFILEVEKTRELVKKNLNDPTKCVEFISSKLDRIDLMQSDSFYPQTEEEIAQLEQVGQGTLQTLFGMKLLIRQKQKALTSQGKLSYECLQNIRRSTRYIRFMEDMLIEWLIERRKLQEKGLIGFFPSQDRFSKEVLQGPYPQLFINPQFDVQGTKTPAHGTTIRDITYEVGDIFLIRGKSYVSAMIARIGDTELQFSHLAILGLNDKKERVIVEALIPYGTKISLFDDWLKQKEARVVLFRFQDPEVAEKAGRSAFELANNFIAKYGKNIPYDFQMSSLNTDTVFCAELIESSFLNASQSKVLLPEHKTMTTKFKATPFLKNMGIDESEIFAPGDIEFDTRFNLVAEYRFLDKYEETDTIPLLRKVRMQDAIIQSLYNWMVADNYQFVDSWKINVKTVFAKMFRFLGFLEDRMPSHMPFSSLKTVIQFEDTSHLLEEHLHPQEEAFYKEKKHSFHFQEMLRILKDYRDIESSKSDSKFANLMRSRN